MAYGYFLQMKTSSLGYPLCFVFVQIRFFVVRMNVTQNDEIVIREDSYNPFVTKTSESLIADDESSGYNDTREKDEDYL
jgi:hypothetical protein